MDCSITYSQSPALLMCAGVRGSIRLIVAHSSSVSGRITPPSYALVLSYSFLASCFESYYRHKKKATIK